MAGTQLNMFKCMYVRETEKMYAFNGTVSMSFRLPDSLHHCST